MSDRNGSWVVSATTWRMTDDGFPKMGCCTGKCFRREEYARDLYDAMVRQYEEDGWMMTPIVKTLDYEEYEGVQGVFFDEVNGPTYMCVFIDRNRTY